MLRILLVKTSSMGDVVHNLPVIADILQHHPDAQIDWLVEESFAEIPKLHPRVAKVITIAIRRWRKSLCRLSTWQEIEQVKKQLKQTQYDAIIDTQGLIKSAFVANWATGKKYGMDWQSAREPLASLCYSKKYPIPRNQHAVARNRQLAALALHYPFPDRQPDYGLTITTPQNDLPTLPAPYAVFLHGTSRDSKLWPLANWVALAKRLAQDHLTIALPWSNVAEFERARAIEAECSNVILLPKLSLTALAEIMVKSVVNIGVDTGLIHLSTALEKPSIAIYTDTNPEFTGVAPTARNLAINIGGKGQIPDADKVYQLSKTYIPEATA